jgi:hypothetical protein
MDDLPQCIGSPETSDCSCFIACLSGSRAEPGEGLARSPGLHARLGNHLPRDAKESPGVGLGQGVVDGRCAGDGSAQKQILSEAWELLQRALVGCHGLVTT